WHLIWAEVTRRRGRTLAVVAAILVASVSFSLLTSAVATSRLQVQGTLASNYRSAYDILVRPAKSTSGLEASDNLVRENFLSGIFGGISMNQYDTIRNIPGVDVAAPVAMVGYALPTVKIPELVTAQAEGDPTTDQLYRLKQMWVSDRGLSHYPAAGYGAQPYLYVTRNPVTYGRQFQVRDPASGKTTRPCTSFFRHIPEGESAFDRKASITLTCFSTTKPPTGHGSDVPRGQIGTTLLVSYPILIAAVDPVQEARLVGLDDAVTGGRYLEDDEGPSTVKQGSAKIHRVPVLMADSPVIDERLDITWERLDVPNGVDVASRLSDKDASTWLQGLPGDSVRTQTLPSDEVYRRLLKLYAKKIAPQNPQYWSTSPVKYQRNPDGHLEPTSVDNPPLTWMQSATPDFPYFAPGAAADTGFRQLHAHTGSHIVVGSSPVVPLIHQVGTFDADRLQGFNDLTHVPLTTYEAPQAEPGDPDTERLLDGQPLRPNSNLAGYLQQPPLMLTTLKGLRLLRNSQAFIDQDGVQGPPISAIRIRVAGVNGIDDDSQERVRLVAERIARDTGLDVDITVGSSPTNVLINLPAGKFGRPDLTLKEGWVKKGVAVQLLSAIDTKSLALFLLVLVVCALFLLNAVTAAVRARSAELGILSCLGWSRRRILWLLETELLVTGLVAGVVGTVVAYVLVSVLDLNVATLPLALIAPVAMLLAGFAGLAPVLRASQAAPLQALRPLVRAPRRARGVRSVFALGLVDVRRTPGRSALAAASLFIAVGSLATLLAIQRQFADNALGSLLGNVVAVDVRGVDLLAAGLILLLAAFTVADVAYLNITERRAEIGTLQATGWATRHLRRLFATEALTIALVGTVAGALVAALGTGFLLHTDLADLVSSALIATGAGLLVSVLALAVPLARIATTANVRVADE
ncbi:MAG: FtsX-like permease family protein, partial [Nocardioides sp.]